MASNSSGLPPCPMNFKHVFALALLSLAALAFFALQRKPTHPSNHAARQEPLADLGKASAPDINRLVEITVDAGATSHELLAAITEKLRQRLEIPQARPGEAVLTFRGAEALRAFLSRAEASGLHVVGSIDAFNTVRIRYDSLPHLARELVENAPGYGQVAANFHINPPPSQPALQPRATRPQTPVGNQLLSAIGVEGANATWGNGVTVAIIDSGVAPDPTFGQGRLKTIDIGHGTAPGPGKDGGHGTAVASIAAGQSTDAPGIAPAANLLSVRVTGSDGKSDVFTVAQAIVAAVDAGSKILNVSLGGHGTNQALDQAIDYALSRGALIVAAAGNDQSNQLNWPAADPRVISVGAVDATGVQALFSNSGEQLKITAPGIAVQAAWTNNKRINFSGTSGSAPVVSGALAALISVTPGLSTQQAWEILMRHTSEAGRPGADADYGNGVINLGWALARNNPARYDTAIASHHYDAASENLQIVLQNRSATGAAGLDLQLNINGSLQHYPVNWIAPGECAIVNLPISIQQLAAAGQIEIKTELINPSGSLDAQPANNQRSTTLSTPSGSQL